MNPWITVWKLTLLVHSFQLGCAQPRKTGHRFYDQLARSVSRYAETKNRPYPCPSGFISHKESCYHLVTPSSPPSTSIEDTPHPLSSLSSSPSSSYHDNSAERQSSLPVDIIKGWTWEEARAHCASLGSKLVSIENDAEQYYLERLIGYSGDIYWTSATNSRSPQTGRSTSSRKSSQRPMWAWSSTREPLDYINWVSDWTSAAYEVPTGSCALIDSTEGSQWMFWPCEQTLYPAGVGHSVEVPVGAICEKTSRRGRKRRKYRKKAKRARKKKSRKRKTNVKTVQQQKNTIGYLLDIR